MLEYLHIFRTLIYLSQFEITILRVISALYLECVHQSISTVKTLADCARADSFFPFFLSHRGHEDTDLKHSRWKTASQSQQTSAASSKGNKQLLSLPGQISHTKLLAMHRTHETMWVLNVSSLVFR